MTALAVVSAAVAHGADTPDGETVQLSEVTVQAQQDRAVSSPKFTAPLVDTPQTISVIPQEIFNSQGAGSLADVLSNTPGITFLAGEGGHVAGANSFVMRGFDTSGNIFIDGVRDNGNYGRDIYNLEQVEVVKGPAGDNGRGSAAGYINLVTKMPRPEDFGSATGSYGFDEYASVERRRASVDANHSLDDAMKGAAIRVNAFWQDGGVPGRDFAEKAGWGISPSLALRLGTPTRVFLGYQHNEQDDRPDFGGMAGSLAGTGTAVRPRGSVDRSRFYGLLEDYDQVSIDVATARIEHDLTPTIRLSNHTRLGQTDREAIYTVPSALDNRPDMTTGEALEMVTTTRQAFFRENQAISNQTNLATQFTTRGWDHSLAAGFEVVRETGHTLRDWTGLGTTGELRKTVNITTAGVATPPTEVIGTDPYQPKPGRGAAGVAPVYRFVDDVQVDTVALYAFDTIRFSPRWQATGGARLEWYEATYDVFDTTNGLPVAPFSADDVLLTGKLGLVFKPAREGSLYVSWGVAAQPPGTASLSNDNGSRNTGGPGTTGQNSPNAKPQKSYNYEAGVKWDFFKRRLTTSVALFRSDRTNISVAQDTNGIPTAYGDQMAQGIEVGVSGRVTPDWVVFGGATVLDTENRNSQNAVQNGSDLNWAASFTGNLWTTYRLPFGLTIGGGTQYSGSSRVSLNNTSAAKLPAFWVLNAMASYDLTKRLSLRLNVNNVADKLYARAINNNSNRAYFGDPRSYLLSAVYKF